MPPLAQVHTLDINHKISQMEVERIKRKYGITKDGDIRITDTGINGINEIVVRKNPVYKDGTFLKYVYTIEAQVNAAKVINSSSVAMVDISNKNMFKMIARLQEIFINQLQLDIRNCCMENWTLARLDTGFDLKIPYDELVELDVYMRLLNHSLNLENNRNCTYYKYKGYDSEEKRRESIALQNSLYRYNIYYKRKELILKGKHFKSLDDWDMTDGVIRFEKQMEGKKISRVTGLPQKLGLLLDENISSRIFADVQADLELFFGSGKYVSYAKGMEIINSSRYSEETKQYMRIVYTASTNYGFQYFLAGCMEHKEDMDSEGVRKVLLDAHKKIESLGISIVGISEDEVRMMGKDTLPNINNLVRRIKVDKEIKREKASFAKIYADTKNNRFRCNPTIHDFNGKGIRKSLAGGSMEELEETIARELYLSMKQNVSQVPNSDTEAWVRIIRQSLKEFEGFLEVAGSHRVRQVVGAVITELNTRLDEIRRDAI